MARDIASSFGVSLIRLLVLLRCELVQELTTYRININVILIRRIVYFYCADLYQYLVFIYFQYLSIQSMCFYVLSTQTILLCVRIYKDQRFFRTGGIIFIGAASILLPHQLYNLTRNSQTAIFLKIWVSYDLFCFNTSFSLFSSSL